MFWMDHNNISKLQFDYIFPSLASIDIPKEITGLEANERFIIIVRHGPTRSTNEGLPGGHKDEQMTSDGIEEVEKVACLLKNIGVGPSFEIFSSPLLRAQRTAEILRKHILNNETTEIVLKNGLIERDVKQLDEIIDKKDYEPEKLREQMEMEKITAYEDYMSYQFKPSKGDEKTESLGKVRDRALETLITIGKELKENIAVVASHGNLMKALSIDEAHKHQYRLSFRGFDLKPCGVMLYKFSADTKKITLIACDKFSLKS